MIAKTYRVEVTAKFPAYNEEPGVIEVVAATAKEAIGRAHATSFPFEQADTGVVLLERLTGIELIYEEI